MALMPNPIGPDENNETVILANRSDTEVSIDLWRLKDRAGGAFTMSGTIAPGSTQRIRLRTSLQLGNSGDSVELVKPNGEAVQTVTYETAPIVRSRGVDAA